MEVPHFSGCGLKNAVIPWVLGYAPVARVVHIGGVTVGIGVGCVITDLDVEEDKTEQKSVGVAGLAAAGKGLESAKVYLDETT